MVTAINWESQPEAQKPEAQKKGAHWLLKLYVAGKTPQSVAAIANLQRLCETNLPGQYEIEVVDLLVDPEPAQGEQIVASPTLVRRSPPPGKKSVGDLAWEDRLAAGLDLWPAPAGTEE